MLNPIQSKNTDAMDILHNQYIDGSPWNSVFEGQDTEGISVAYSVGIIQRGMVQIQFTWRPLTNLIGGGCRLHIGTEE